MCPRCDRDLPLAAYQKNRNKGGGVQTYCRECAAYYRAQRPGQKEYNRAAQLRCKYGIETAEWDRLFEGQGRACAICRREEFGVKKPAVDHCHRTGVIRGLLCGPCNRALGYMRDDPEILQRAIAYLGGVHGM